MKYKFKGQAFQDAFVIKVLQEKRGGFFLELGSNHPEIINNTFLLEKEFDWRGIIVEDQNKYLSLYQQHRCRSFPIMKRAQSIDYKNYLINLKAPKNIDYLQIDLEVANGSTLETLEHLNSTIFDDYKFAVVTFEHDIRRRDESSIFETTRSRSREIFKHRGYTLVFPDVQNAPKTPYEDWYVHPHLVNMDYINLIKSSKSFTGKEIALKLW